MLETVSRRRGTSPTSLRRSLAQVESRVAALVAEKERQHAEARDALLSFRDQVVRDLDLLSRCATTRRFTGQEASGITAAWLRFKTDALAEECQAVRGDG